MAARFTVQGSVGQASGCYLVDNGQSVPTVVMQSDYQSCLNMAATLNGQSSPAVPTHTARGICLTNQSIASFASVTGGTIVDGVTYAAGDRVFLAGQTTTSQNGIYTIGAVSSGTAPLTYAPDWASGSTLPAETLVAVSEGTVNAHTLWRLLSQGSSQVIGTASLSFAMAADTSISVDPRCRCVSDANVNLATIGLGTIDGVTVLAGDRVLLANQTSAAANGVYVAASGTWALAPDYVQGAVKAGMVFEVSEGTTYANTTWKITAAQVSVGGYITVGTTDPAFYPKTLKGTTAAMTAGSTGSLSSHIWLLTGAVVMATENTAGGTVGTLKCTTRTPGKAGTGAITIQSSGGSDTSTVDYLIVNW